MPDAPQREILPIPDITPPGLTTFDAKDLDTTYPPIEPLRPPVGAPNVLVILIVTGGPALYAKGGKPKFVYNFFGLEETFVEGEREIPAGTHQVRFEFAYDGGGIAKGGTVTLFVDGEETGSGHLDRTQPLPFSGDEAVDLGSEFGSLVTTDYGQREFSGEVNWAEIELGLDDHEHLISPEERLNLAMAIQ